MLWRCRDLEIDLSHRTLVMGVLNVTPDSFSDGGRYATPDSALAHARRLRAEGADLLDLGGESTRPGSQPVSADEQWRRIGPVIEALTREGGALISVDTGSASVAERALVAGELVDRVFQILIEGAAVQQLGEGIREDFTAQGCCLNL